MRALIAVSLAVFATASVAGASTGIPTRPSEPGLRLAQAEREGQDPDPEGADELPVNDGPEERVGQDPDVPGGNTAGTPKVVAPEERVGQDPDVPGGDEPVR